MIDALDRQILFELDLNARLSEAQLARKLKKLRRQISYRIERLNTQGIITKFTTWVDFTKLGFQSYKIYLKLYEKLTRIEDLVAYLAQNPNAWSWFQAHGSYSFGISFIAYSHQQFYEIERELLQKFDDIILSKLYCNMVDVIVCSKNYLTGNKSVHAKAIWNAPNQIKLNKQEKQILLSLHQDAKQNIVDIARDIHSTFGQVNRRIKDLEKKGIISFYSIDINHELLNFEFYKALVYVHSMSVKEENRFIEFLRQHPNVFHIIRTVGPWRFEIEMMASNYNEWNNFITQLKREFVTFIREIDSSALHNVNMFLSKNLIFSSLK